MGGQAPYLEACQREGDRAVAAAPERRGQVQALAALVGAAQVLAQQPLRLLLTPPPHLGRDKGLVAAAARAASALVRARGRGPRGRCRVRDAMCACTRNDAVWSCCKTGPLCACRVRAWRRPDKRECLAFMENAGAGARACGSPSP